MPGEPLDPPEPRPSYSIYLLLHNILRLLAADDCEIVTRTLPQAAPPGGGQRRALTTPHDYVPGGPVEAAPLGGCCPPARQEAFSAVLEDVEKGAYDHRIIAWLAQLDDTTCAPSRRLCGAAALQAPRPAPAWLRPTGTSGITPPWSAGPETRRPDRG
jgi:hypothetical protein